MNSNKIILVLYFIYICQTFAFFNGQQVAIRPAAFPNAYLRMDGAACSSSTDSGCGTVNAQYYPTVGSSSMPTANWEVFTLYSSTNGGWCIQSSHFTSANLRIDGSGCNAFNSNGCGVANAQYYATSGTCSGYESFNFISIGNGQYAIQSRFFPNNYLRIDGSSCSTSADSGCGVVNTQYHNGDTISGYEAFYIIDIDCNYYIDFRCFKPWSGTLSNNMNFLMQSQIMYNGFNPGYFNYVDFLKQGPDSFTGSTYLGTTLTTSGWNRQQTTNPSSISATADKVMNVNNVNGNIGNFNWGPNRPLYWDGAHNCGNPDNLVQITATNDGNYPNTYYLKTNGCGSWSGRLYTSNDWQTVKADYDGYIDQRVYYFKIFNEKNN